MNPHASWAQADALRAENARALTAATTPPPKPVTAMDRSRNPLRPRRLDEVMGQANAKRLLRRVIDAAKARRVPLDHMLLVGAAGTGKTTLATVIAEEMGTQVFQLEAPVAHDTLLQLRETAQDGDVVFIDEIHQQAIMERRGRQTSTQPEVLYAVLEDRTIVSGTGVLPFPHLTFVGATTDEGMLPDAFVARFPLKPVLEKYGPVELARIAQTSGRKLGITVTDDAAIMFAGACRGIPREVNNYVRNAAMLTAGDVDAVLAREVIEELNHTALDGLTYDQQRLLVFLYDRAKRTNGAGDTTYQASVGTIATALGKSRDQKIVALRIEPTLIERGYLQVGHGGRALTDAGVKRARKIKKEATP